MESTRAGRLLLAACLAVGSAASAQVPQKLIQKVLHYKKLSGFNHSKGIEGCEAALTNLSKQYGFFLKNSVDVADIKNVREYDVVVYDNTVSDGGAQGVTPADAQKPLVDYLEGGGAFLGIHGASDYDCAGWDWYYKYLFSGNCFKGHGSGSFTLELDADMTEDPALMNMWRAAGFQNTVTFNTEKYRFKGSLASVREDPAVKVMQKMSKSSEDYPDHYYTWTKPIGNGRMVYTGLGHGTGDWDQNERWLEKALWHWMLYLKKAYDTGVVPVRRGTVPEGLAGAGSGTFRLQLFDVSGKLAATRHSLVIGDLDYSRLAKPGLYLATFRFPSGLTTSKKVVIP